jgi:hypothetical protein
MSKKLYIDGGCFIGDSIMRFINNEADDSGNKFRPHISSEYEIQGFDGQIYEDQWKKIASICPNVKFNSCLLGDSTRIIEFHGKKNCMCNSIFWHRDNTNDKEVKSKNMYQIDLLELIKNKRAKGTEYVIAKLDIEGSEYGILEKMFSESSHHLFNELYIEFHDFLFPNDIEMKNKTMEFKKRLKALNSDAFYYDEWKL